MLAKDSRGLGLQASGPQMIARRSVLSLLQGSTHFYSSQESPKGNGAACLRERREPSHSPQMCPLYQTPVRVTSAGKTPMMLLTAVRTLSPLYAIDLMGLDEIRGTLSKALFLW